MTEGHRIAITATLNGDRPADSHPRLPRSAAAIVADAVAVRAAGAQGILVRAHDPAGTPTLDPDVVDELARSIRRACQGLTVTVTAGLGSASAPGASADAVGRWREPHAAAVRLSQPAHADLMDAVLSAGIGLDAVVATPADVQRLGRTGLADEVSRVVVAPDSGGPATDQVVLARAVERALDAAAIHAPRSHRGSGPATWDVLRAAVARGRGICVGLADTFVGLDGRPAPSNAALVRAARKLTEPSG